MKKLGLALSLLLLMSACSGRGPSPLVVATVNPSQPPSIDQGQRLQFTASVLSNAVSTSSIGVTWTATGPGCSGATCGSFTNVGPTSATYVAPANVSASLAVTVSATPVSPNAQTGSSTFYVNQPPTIITTNLPGGTPTYLYNTTLTASGGVQPYTWSVSGGSLPAGVGLNSAGTIYGTPSTGGTSTFTVKVTDSSVGTPGGPQSAQQSFSIAIAGLLSVPAANLPNGRLGSAYSTLLPVAGGTPPLTWSIYSGDLPTGLLLQQNTGVISGTPTQAGTFSFQVYVVDSSPTQQFFTSPTFTITITPSGPLTVRTTALLDGATGAPYQAQLAATGGTAPLTWTVTSGILPGGLPLNTSGSISGTVSALPNTYTFTVQVADSSVPQQTSSQQLSITINAAAPTCSSTGNNSVLNGQYAFSLRGYNAIPSATNNQQGFLALIGSFTADGNGNITAGEADTNGVLGAQNGNLLTSASSYSVGPDNRGCATFATPFGTFFTRFALGGVSAGVATAGRIIEFENPGPTAYIASGQILVQSPAAFLSPLTGSYALRTSGWDPSAGGRVACVGVLTGSAFEFSYLQQDCNDDGTVSNTVTIVTTKTNTTLNTYTSADTNGRGTGILSVNGNISDLAFYWTSNTELLIVNADPGTAFSGDWTLQTPPSGSPGFNQSAFNGTVAAYASGVGPSGVGGEVSIAAEVANGSSSLSSQFYRDVAGAWQNTSTTCSYSVVSIGRMTLVGGNCGANPPILYLDALNSGYLLGTNANIELGIFEPQTTGLTNAALAGTYFMGTQEVVSQDSQPEVGIINLTNAGVLTSTTDSTSTLNQFVSVAASDSYTVNSANGAITTGSSGSTVVGVAITPTHFVIVSNPAFTFPLLQVAQQ